MNKKLIISTLLLLISSPSFGQDNLSEEEKKRLEQVQAQQLNTASDNGRLDSILENNPELNAGKFLSRGDFNIYSQDRIRIGDEFDFEKPLNFEEVRDLSHPYLKERMDLIRDKDLEELAKLRLNDRFKGLRASTIYNEALKFGSQNALYKSMFEFKEDMKEIGDYYDRIFNFSMFMLADGRVRPPVLLVRGSSLVKEDDYTLKRTDAAYKIYKQAQVVTRPPSYMDYLTFGLIKPKEPNVLLLPRPDFPEEMEAWREGIRDGWNLGIRQSNDIINEGLYSLLTDYYGMAQFYLASKSGLISMPQYQEMNLGITSDGDNLQVGEEIFSITILPQFNDRANTWIPIPEIENFLELNN